MSWKLPRLKFWWVKVEAHLSRDPQIVNEVLNVEIDELAGTAHIDPLWKAKTSAQTFESTIVELTIDKKRVTGNACTALQCAYKYKSVDRKQRPYQG